jgi:hypothetical protein
MAGGHERGDGRVTGVSEQNFALDDELAALVESVARAGDVLIIPEFVEEIDGNTVAAFADSTQELRVDLADRGLQVQLALPEGAEPRPYEEHFVEWVLPVILSVPGAIVATAQIIGWLRDWHSRNRDRVLRYREARFDEDEGRYVVRELVGPADRVADVLERGIGGTTREVEGSDGED